MEPNDNRSVLLCEREVKRSVNYEGGRGRGGYGGIAR
jgi:hypothetical protein